MAARMALGSTRGALYVLGAAALALTALACGSPAGATAGRGGPPAAPRGLRVVGVSPAPGSPAANGAAPVVVQMSGLLDASSPRPQVTPSIPGRWSVVGARFVFEPVGAFPPGSRVVLTLPAGRAGVVDAAGHRLARRASFSWLVGGLGVMRAEQILAGLGDLPVRFEPAAKVRLDRFALAKAVYEPPTGRFVWDWDAPAPLRAAFTAGRPSLVLTGALMTLQDKLGLPVTGELDADTQAALVAAARDPGPAVEHLGYRYALVVESDPETFTLYQKGRVVLQSPANTGIPEAPTTTGTFPVYLRFATQVMKGNLPGPDGAPYADPVAWVAYFDGGQAVHYIDRSWYGSPQSLGCVELPWDAAAQAWPLLTIGTLVTVEA